MLNNKENFVKYLKLDLERLKEASELFIGTHDYRNFCNNNEVDEDYIRTIYSIEITKNKNYIEFSFIDSNVPHRTHRFCFRTLGILISYLFRLSG